MLRRAVSTISSTPRLPSPSPLSSADAQQVWARAAELQANTGAQVPPAHFAPSADSETRGYTPAIVKEAAVDAGIDAGIDAAVDPATV